MFAILPRISTIVRQFKRARNLVPLWVTVFLVGGTLIANLWASFEADGSRGVLGGPIASHGEFSSPIEDTSLAGTGNTGNSLAGEEPRYDALLGASVRDEGGVLQGPFAQSGIISYTVREGDTLSGIAARFGISVTTILGVNPGIRPTALQVGESIDILPVSGILYRVREGETPESVASLFSLSTAQLREFNRSVDWNDFGAGTTLVIPGARPGEGIQRSGRLPDLSHYFILPSQGFNWGRLHTHNAVDIANACGTPVIAAAEGLVVPDDNYGDGSSGWNSGYGNFVLIEHPNGTATRYSHLQEVSVSIGEYLKQGDEVGIMGNTGNVHGPTGCHLHFEVYGAQNPFAR